MTEMNCDVVVAGAGPVGLLLAAELQLAGVAVIVLERLTELSLAIKAGGINGRSTQLLARRGLRRRLQEESTKYGDGFTAFARSSKESDDANRPKQRFAGHFSGLFLHPETTVEIPASTVLPQQALEQMLFAWATELGVKVLRGHHLKTFEQDLTGVTVLAACASDEISVRGIYLAGCDGGRSTVRKLAGIDFLGTDPLTTGYQAIVTLDQPERLPMGWHVTPTGLYAHGPKKGRILLLEFCGPPAFRDAELTLEELQGSLHRVSGTEVTITEVTASTRYTDNTRQAASYRDRRVLLAGDAAHIHPPFGGQGLNLGLQDAANLAWKLAATIKGWAPEDLLDSYSKERHPVGAAVLTNTRAQVGMMRPDSHSRAMRELFGALLQETPELTERLVARLQGLDIRYEMGAGSHPLIGRHVPDLPGVEDAMRLPRPILFDLIGSDELRNVVAGWADRLDVQTLAPSTEIGGLLVRPDGYVAWAVDRTLTAQSLLDLRTALKKWFGEPFGHPGEKESASAELLPGVRLENLEHG